MTKIDPTPITAQVFENREIFKTWAVMAILKLGQNSGILGQFGWVKMGHFAQGWAQDFQAQGFGGQLRPALAAADSRAVKATRCGRLTGRDRRGFAAARKAGGLAKARPPSVLTGNWGRGVNFGKTFQNFLKLRKIFKFFGARDCLAVVPILRKIVKFFASRARKSDPRFRAREMPRRSSFFQFSF